MSDYLYHHNANTHWAYPTSEETDVAIEDARVACADLLNASPTEIAFGANMTTLTFHLARALASDFAAGDELVVTELDHHANVAPWQRVAAERRLTLRTVRMDPLTGQLDWDSFEGSITKRTKLVAIGAASNALGTINDLTRATSAARSVGALVFVDAVHYVPHALVDVRALDCDFLAVSAYKFYGPHIGVLFGKRELLQTINFPKLLPAPDEAPENVETGTQNQEGMVGTLAAVEFLASLQPGAGSRRAQLVSYLRGIARTKCCLDSTDVGGVVRDQRCPLIRSGSRTGSHADYRVYCGWRGFHQCSQAIGQARIVSFTWRLLCSYGCRATGPWS